MRFPQLPEISVIENQRNSLKKTIVMTLVTMVLSVSESERLGPSANLKNDSLI